MKSLQLNKKSWHYRLANHYGNFKGYDWKYEPVKTNICEYSQEVLFGFLTVLLFTLCILAVSLTIMSAVLWAIVCIQFWVYVLPDDFANFGIGIFGAAILIGLFVTFLYFIEKYTKDQETKYVHKEPGFLKIWYTNFKSKTCVPIELK